MRMMQSGLPDMASSGGTAQREAAAIAEFEAYADCPTFSETVRVSVCDVELRLTGLFDQLTVPYADVQFITFADYQVNVRSASGHIVLSRMGRNAEWLYGKMRDAFNDAVAKALMADGECLMRAAAFFEAREGEREFGGACEVRLYRDSLLLLPPNVNARRIPLCFLTGMRKGDYEITFSLATGEEYCVSRLGRELENLERMAAERVRALREDTSDWHRKLAPDLASDQMAQLARLMPLGTAAHARDIEAVAPMLLAAMEGKARESGMLGTLSWLKDYAAGEGLLIGAKPELTQGADGSADRVGMAGLAGLGGSIGAGIDADAVAGEAVNMSTGIDAEDEVVPDTTVWVLAPNVGMGIVAVELALASGEAAATYLYRIPGEWRSFARWVDRALEAAALQRGPFLLSEEELRQPRHAQEAMLIARTPAIALLRSCFAGRAIHSSQQRWLRDIQAAQAKR